MVATNTASPEGDNKITASPARVEWLRADTLRPWRDQRAINKAMVNKIAREFDPDLLHPLVVSRRGGKDSLVDGQHRWLAIVSVMGWGDQNVPCLVYENLTDDQEAMLFLAQAPGNRRQIDTLHTMHVLYNKGDREVCAIVAAVERAGLRVNWGGGHASNTTSSAGALRRVGSTYGCYRLQLVLELLRDAFGPEESAYRSDMIRGAAGFHIRYEESYDRRNLIEKLRPLGTIGIQREALAFRQVLGGSMETAIGRAIHKTYNSGKRTNALGVWVDNFIPSDIAEQARKRIAVSQADNWATRNGRVAQG